MKADNRDKYAQIMELLNIKDPYNDELTKEQILYIYTMNTNLYTLLNNAVRTKDRTKIRTFGAFSYVLEDAIKEVNAKLPFKGRYMPVYKGANLTPDELAAYKSMVGEKHDITAIFTEPRLMGEKEEAIRASLDNRTSGKTPVLFWVLIVDDGDHWHHNLDIYEKDFGRKMGADYYNIKPGRIFEVCEHKPDEYVNSGAYQGFEIDIIRMKYHTGGH